VSRVPLRVRLTAAFAVAMVLVLVGAGWHRTAACWPAPAAPGLNP
jgi:hypothetical protein